MKKLFTPTILYFVFVIMSYAQPDDNVIAYYSFNRNANDVSGNGKNASVSGATLTSEAFMMSLQSALNSAKN